MILVDGIASPQTDRLDSLLGREAVAIGDLIVAEVLQGFSDEREYEDARMLLGSLTFVDFGRR